MYVVCKKYVIRSIYTGCGRFVNLQGQDGLGKYLCNILLFPF